MQSKTGEQPVTFFIIFDLLAVYTTVDFNNKPVLHAEEVNDETTYDLLTAEMQAVQTVDLQRLPQLTFSWRHPSAHGLGGLGLDGVDMHPSYEALFRHTLLILTLPSEGRVSDAVGGVRC